MFFHCQIVQRAKDYKGENDNLVRKMSGLPATPEDLTKFIAEKKKIRVKINGTIYPSIKEAAQELNMSEVTLGRWIKDKRKIGYEIV